MKASRLDHVVAYARVANLKPVNAEAQHNLGVAYFESGDDKLAIAQAKILRQLDEKLYEKLISETRLEQECLSNPKGWPKVAGGRSVAQTTGNKQENESTLKGCYKVFVLHPSRVLLTS